MGDRALHGPLNRHADQGADGVDDDVCGFEGMAVGDNFGDFMDCADGGHADRNVRRWPPRPTQAISEGKQCVGGEMRYPAQGAGEG